MALLTAKLADQKDRHERAALARQSVYAEAAQKREAERSRAAAKEQRVLQEAALSENAEVQLVTLRLAKQSYFDNTSHKNADVWEAIAKEYNDLCEAGRSGLTAADARAASALTAKFSKYLNDFKKWADKANRAHARSGVQADEVLEKVSEHQRASTCAALIIVYLYVYDNTHVCLGRVCTFSPPTESPTPSRCVPNAIGRCMHWDTRALQEALLRQQLPPEAVRNPRARDGRGERG